MKNVISWLNSDQSCAYLGGTFCGSLQLQIQFFKMVHSWPLFNLFSSFQTNITMFTTNLCEKCPSSIRCWDSNSRPSEHGSPPITTRPGLPPCRYNFSVRDLWLRATYLVKNSVPIQWREIDCLFFGLRIFLDEFLEAACLTDHRMSQYLLFLFHYLTASPLKVERKSNHFIFNFFISKVSFSLADQKSVS